jgi:hypothetical protein
MNHPDWGRFRLLLILENSEGVWEKTWEPLRQAEEFKPLVDLLSRIDEYTFNEALKGHSMPVLKNLGISPEHCTRKLQKHEINECLTRVGCSAWTKEDCRFSSKTPICFVPKSENEAARQLASQIAQHWREGTWVVVTSDSQFSSV